MGGAVVLIQSSCGPDNTEAYLNFTSILTKSPGSVMPALAPSPISVTGTFSRVPVLFAYGHPHDNRRSLKAKVKSKWPGKQTSVGRFSKPWASLKCLSCNGFGLTQLFLYTQTTNRLCYADHKSYEGAGRRDVTKPTSSPFKKLKLGSQERELIWQELQCTILCPFLNKSMAEAWGGTTWGLGLHSLKS